MDTGLRAEKHGGSQRHERLIEGRVIKNFFESTEYNFVFVSLGFICWGFRMIEFQKNINRISKIGLIC